MDASISRGILEWIDCIRKLMKMKTDILFTVCLDIDLDIDPDLDPALDIIQCLNPKSNVMCLKDIQKTFWDW